MSVTILDIMHLPSLQEARIVAGMNGINRSIASVSVLEAAAAKDLDIDLPGHATNYGQEIILTAFVAYRDSVDAQCEAIHALHKEGEAGIIIFYVGSILPSIDPRVIDLANELEMPIIVMPEGRLDLRYSDVICEIMEAIINDRRENSYFTTEVIERISHLGTSQRSINNAVAIIRDRVQCSIYLMDELGRMLNMAEWPNGRNLPADKFYTTLTNDTAQITGVQEVYIDGKTYLADIETIQSTGSILYMLVVKEKGSLTQESCKQIKYIIKTYINLWTENYGQLDTKQLVSSIINDEPEKMRHIANAIKINVDNLSCAYFFYLKDGSHEFICLQKMREIIKDFISVYKNTFLTDIFDDTVIVFADRRRERIDDDLPNLLHELEVRGLLCCVIINDTFETTQDVKHAYWAFQNYKKEISILFPRKRVVTGGEVSVVGRAKDNANTSSMSLADQLLTQKREADLMTTLEVYMLDADRSMQRTSIAVRWAVSIRWCLSCSTSSPAKLRISVLRLWMPTQMGGLFRNLTHAWSQQEDSPRHRSASRGTKRGRPYKTCLATWHGRVRKTRTLRRISPKLQKG